MFEHMKNYKSLLRKVSSWLRPTSKANSEESLLFIHIFCHKTTPYHFEEGDGWMAQTFFSGEQARRYCGLRPDRLIFSRIFRRNYAITRSAALLPG